jgi:hypothetical protein
MHNTIVEKETGTLTYSQSTSTPTLFCLHNSKGANKIRLLLFIIFSGSAAQRGLWPPRSRGFVITQNDAPQSVELLWTSDQLVAVTST